MLPCVADWATWRIEAKKRQPGIRHQLAECCKAWHMGITKVCGNDLVLECVHELLAYNSRNKEH